MLLLREATCEPMAMCAELLRSYSEACGPGCWGITYTADVRARRDHVERIRRRRTSEAPVHFDPARPWGTVFQKACSPSGPETQAYWSREVFNKSLQFVTQAREPADLISE
eukprot:8939001-Alexandrium_andersonii.AAC.1